MTYPCVAVSLIAEKAFDLVEWQYLFETMGRINIGPKFTNLVKLLYKHPTAQIQTNKDISARFVLSRSTRLLPFAPIIFAVAIEPLATAIRSNPAIHGIQIGDCIYTLSLYADDILTYLSSPEESTPALMDALTEYGKISDYKININKCVVIPLNAKAEADPPDTMFQLLKSVAFRKINARP